MRLRTSSTRTSVDECGSATDRRVSTLSARTSRRKIPSTTRFSVEFFSRPPVAFPSLSVIVVLASCRFVYACPRIAIERRVASTEKGSVCSKFAARARAAFPPTSTACAIANSTEQCLRHFRVITLAALRFLVRGSCFRRGPRSSVRRHDVDLQSRTAALYTSGTSKGSASNSTTSSSQPVPSIRRSFPVRTRTHRVISTRTDKTEQSGTGLANTATSRQSSNQA